MRTRLRLAAALLVVAPIAAGCGSVGGLYDMPLPGGADLGDHPFRVTAQFRDVLDLVPQSGVKVGDVSVGRVETIELAPDGRTALVTVVVNGSVSLPANSVARLRMSSVLGEKFIELDAPPDDSPDGKLSEGDQIPLERTDRNPQIEEVFGALSLLLNGGGVGQLQQITKELNAAYGGNEEAIRSLLKNMNTFVSGLDARKNEITRALDGMGKLAESLGSRKEQIANMIDNLTPGIETLSQQREKLVGMLGALDMLSDVAVDTIQKSKDDMIADLRALEPTLRKLNEAGAEIPRAMEMLLTFPFPDSALDAIKGDYLNTYLKLDAKVAPPPTIAGAPNLPLPSNEQGGR
ncbi:phospholipid/cholesterol/gamma-HCH transport system substrate-binding protein [Actinokineospora alba]|uniref:Phospholipid/cholesterol/gamma-HCH transport system substrate-binding protein n=1 Tax=Actinokineospora alba TaxID=504798 RepID=A0A1H0US58_9PSEU|nr:MCE family protein [Actinokineospora alba]TDP69099.1 phospholipid/cholesterol/gamma-HCH transport system substrate-binding protein [Actinokineospora alba]SDI79530.1 phospholipid/cholesterol/gamma-HCH transport system substrate-binding protein [Actinokineospora alba]SDP68981.1 phospholipid/cholesterol/gamma-HCH transport system substrate-binding protein [Actinokineospora alba]